MQIARIELALRTLDSFRLPDFKGSTFRGKFGHVLREIICSRPGIECRHCDLSRTCAYIYLFEPKNPEGEDIPRPFVLEPPLTGKRNYLRNEWLYLNIALFGKAINYLPYFVYAFEQMGREGIGKDNGRFLLVSVRSLDLFGNKEPLYDVSERKLYTNLPLIDLNDFESRHDSEVTIEFLTPAQIKRRGKKVYSPDFPLLLKSIIRRFQALRRFYGDGIMEHYEIDWKAANEVVFESNNLKRRDLKRFSNRQGRPVPLSGFSGRITYRGKLGSFLPWLKIGEQLHIGSGTVFGMGWYRIV